jgi:hypothetical protein
VRGIQIGPRIRVGGTVGKIGQSIKEGVGKVAKVAAPVVSMFNPALGAVVGGAGTVLDTSGGGVGVGDILKSGVANYGIGRVAQAAGLSDRARGLLGSLGIGGGDSSDGSGTIADASTGGMPGEGGGVLDNIKAEIMRGVGRVTGGHSPISVNGQDPLLGGASDGTSGGSGGGSSLLDKLLLGGTVAAGAMDEVDRKKLRDRAVGYASNSYDARAPLRDRAMALLKDNTPTDLTSMFSDPGNVYDRQRRARALLPAPATPTAT